MKHALKLLALLSITGLSTAFAAETAGLAVPEYVSAQAGLGLFVATLAVLTFGTDYRRRSRLITQAARPMLLPASDAFRPAPALSIRATVAAKRQQALAAR